MIYAIPITALGMAAAVGFVLGRGRGRRGVALLFCSGILGLTLAFTHWAPKPLEYVDAVAMAAVGALIAIPGLAGLAGGALFGWLLQRHAKTA